MTTSVEAMTASVPVSGGSRALRRLTLTEAKLFMRERVGLIWGVGFPIVLLIIFGSIPGFRKPISASVPGLTGWPPRRSGPAGCWPPSWP